MWDRHISHLLAGCADNVADGVLHFFLQLTEPAFDGAFAFLELSERDSFLVLAHHLNDGFDDFFVLLFGVLVENDLVNGIEKLLEIFLDRSGFRTLGKNLQKRLIGNEVETREFLTFLLQILFQTLLADIEVLLEIRQEIFQHIVLTTLNDFLGLYGFLHDLEPVLVNALELLGFYRHLTSDITACENGFQTGPAHLHLDPHVKRFTDFTEHADLAFDDVLERSDMALRVHSGQLHLIFIETLGDFGYFHTVEDTRVVTAFAPSGELENGGFPEGLDFFEIPLDLQLFISGIGDIHDIFLEAQ